MTVREIPMPALTTEQRVKIAIRCALRVWANVDFTRWAERWLNVIDRSAAAAWGAARETGWEASWETTCGEISEAAALNAEIDVAAVIEEVVENDRNAQIIEEGKCVTN